jgi:hypothetical protein
MRDDRTDAACADTAVRTSPAMAEPPRCPECDQPMAPAMTPDFYAVWVCGRCERQVPRPLED